jgi:AraC family ethanolamine operon transcriptional activator
MPDSVTSVFSESEDFETALRKEGCLGMVTTGRGQFRARLTQVALYRLHLSAGEEQLSRIGFVAAPPDMIMISFPTGAAPSLIWAGIRMQAGEMMTVGPGQGMHARTDGLCRWGIIRLPVEELIRYGRALTGAQFAVPFFAQCWLPTPAAGRELRQLHAAAIRMAQTRPHALVNADAAHGLEQQLIETLVECLATGAAATRIADAQRHQDIMARFEDLLRNRPDRNLPLAEICAGLGVSGRLLRSLCAAYLGLSPTGYLRLRRMSLVRRALGRGDDGVASVSEVARHYGFRERGRFAAGYRGLFGELPSVTLRRGLRGGVPDVVRRRRRWPE